MLRRLLLLPVIAILVGAGVVQAQLLPPLPVTSALTRLGGALNDVSASVRTTLADTRQATIDRLIRDHPRAIARDPRGYPARAGEVVVNAPSAALIEAATAAGYRVIERDDVLGIAFVRLSVPGGTSLRAAIATLRKLGGSDVSADQIHLPSGAVAAVAHPALIPSGVGRLVGVIDGGVAGAALSRGFAAGAPRANDHGTAVVSLIAGSGPVRGALPGARIASADVYGSDPAGGNATAIAKALGWMVAQGVAVVTISLTGPPNPLLGKVVAAAQARGLVIVAAVGNDGPAAPPAYPASYPGVIAVTAVDGHDRVLIEAGHATHLDYAAPGADMLAADASGGAVKVRGTSFAAPLVAATIARFYPALSADAVRPALARVDALARDIGSRGRFGRGLVCGDCRTPAR